MSQSQQIIHREQLEFPNDSSSKKNEPLRMHLYQSNTCSLGRWNKLVMSKKQSSGLF